MRTLHSKTLISEEKEKLFDFFCKAENLEALSPPWLRFRIVTPLPIEMRKGSLIDYKLKLHGVPIRWRTEIVDWNPPESFTDSQIRGPYSTWIHQHVFESVDDGTLMHDIVKFKSPGWLLEPIVHNLFVKKDLEKIFKFRIQEFGRHYRVISQAFELDGKKVDL